MAKWEGKEVSYEEYWKLRLQAVASNVTKESLTELLLDLDMDNNVGEFRYNDEEE